MDETTRTGRDPGGAQPGPQPGPQPGAQSEQVRLPFERPPVAPLPFDDEADEPIGFALTARARRTVAPTTLPELSVVGATDDDPTDTRPSRARALRRAGTSVADIARSLGVDELLVRAWVDDVIARPTAPRRSGASRAAAVLAAPAGDPDPSRRSGPADPDGDHRRQLVRPEFVAEGRRRLATDALFAAGVGLLAGLVWTDAHALGFRTDRPELAARALSWLNQHAAADPRDVRVVLRLGKTVAGDLARHRWASALGIGTEQLAFTRSRHTTDAEAVEALVRISDAEVAARVAGWCEALLHPDVDPADVAF
jgi:hypothetical protein